MHAHLSPSRIHLTKWLCYWNCLAPKEGGQFHVPSFPLPLRHSFPKVIQFGSVFQLCSMLCDPVDHSTPGLPVDHQLREFTQTHVHWVGDAIHPSHPLSSPSSLAFNLSRHQGLFKWVSSLHQVSKVLEFQLQHQSFQWIFRTDFLMGFICCYFPLTSLCYFFSSDLTWYSLIYIPIKIDTHFYIIYFWKSETFANHHMHLLCTVSPWEERGRMRMYLPGWSPFCIYSARHFLC